MTRIAIVGGGISGLTAAYQLELARRAGAPIDWHLYEAGPRLGGTVETTRIPTPTGEYILEGGPDAWVTEKPWARDLAIELNLAADLIPSNDATRRTYIYLDHRLQPIPDRMRLMVPDGPDALPALASSPLFSPAARHAFHDELTRSAELKHQAPTADESIATFVRRHFAPEVLSSLAAPLLSGIFGGDVERLSVRAVMPQFVALERTHGSLIAGLEARSRASGAHPPQPIFTTLLGGMASLTEALIATLPPERLHLNTHIRGLWRTADTWTLDLNLDSHFTPRPRLFPSTSRGPFDQLILATSLHFTRNLLTPIAPEAAKLLPTHASSATLACLGWPPGVAATFTVPDGFGFLVPQASPDQRTATPQLLAATFVDQKFPHRAPPGARIIRAFFGSGSAEHFSHAPDATIVEAALTQLRSILGPLPAPDAALTTVRRWSGSLPQYEVGHLDRIAQLEALVAEIPGLHLLGNSYHGVGLPDLIHAARTLARRIAQT